MSQHDNSQFFKNCTVNAFLGLLTQQKHHNIFLHYHLKYIRLLTAVLLTKNLIFCHVPTWYWPNRSIHGMRIKFIDFSTWLANLTSNHQNLILDFAFTFYIWHNRKQKSCIKSWWWCPDMISERSCWDIRFEDNFCQIKV